MNVVEVVEISNSITLYLQQVLFKVHDGGIDQEKGSAWIFKFSFVNY